MLGIAATTVVIPGNVSVSSGNTVLGGNVNISRSYARKSGQSALVIYEANGNDGTSSSGSLVFSGGGDKHESTILFKSNEVSTDFGYLKYEHISW
jgi:lipopolysaccharide export system protein LptA